MVESSLIETDRPDLILNNIDIIKKIQKRQNTLSVSIGVAIGVILSAYFFSFAMLIDKGSGAFLAIQGITTIIFVFVLIFLKRVSFFFTRLTLGGNPDIRRVLSQLTVKDLDKDAETVSHTLRQ
jgi:hypothetical protein